MDERLSANGRWTYEDGITTSPRRHSTIGTTFPDLRCKGQQEDLVDQNSFEEFMKSANWWSGESFAALTDARPSGQQASTSDNITLESECRPRLAAASCMTCPPCCAEGCKRNGYTRSKLPLLCKIYNREDACNKTFGP